MRIFNRAKSWLRKGKNKVSPDKFDPQGSYTGTPDYGTTPQQDADDL